MAQERYLLNKNNKILRNSNVIMSDEYTSAFVISNADLLYTFNNLLEGRDNVVENMIKNIGASTSFLWYMQVSKETLENNSSIGLFLLTTWKIFVFQIEHLKKIIG